MDVFSSLASPLAPTKSPLYQSGPGVQVGVPVGVGVGVPPPEIVPSTPMEKSENTDVKLAPPPKLLLKNAFRSLPHGVPTQLAPLVVESNERPVRSPIGVTLSQ